MRRNSFLFKVIAFCVVAGMLFVGFKVVKRIYRYIQKPRLYDARSLMESISSPAEHPNVKIFAASSLDRIFKDGKTLLKPTYSKTVSMSAARHEYESFQVGVFSKTETLSEVSLEVSDLIDSKAGNKIGRENIKWYVVGYVQTIVPYYPVKFVGLWPDPLLTAKPTNIEAGTVQPFWVSVYISPETPPGDYNGTVTVKSETLILATVPLHVHVYDFTLPNRSHLKTAFDFYEHITKIRYPQGEKESALAWRGRLDALNDEFLLLMLKYRMNPVLNVDPTRDSDLARVDRFMIYGLNNFSIGKFGGTFDNNWPKDTPSIEALLPVYRTYGENLKLNKMLDYTYIYTWDEGDMRNPLVPKITSMIHRAYPGLKNMVCYHGIWDPIDNPSWGKDIDIWTFQIDNYNEKKMAKLKKLGIEMWTYISGPSGTGSPNLAMDFDSIDYRIIPWMAWKYDIRGFLYWCVNWWPKVDPFASAHNSDWEQNGNGLLFYPGEQGPLPSLRAEIFRDGMEDYEYIYALLKKMHTLKSQKLDQNHPQYIQESTRLLTMDEGLIKSFYQFNKDGDFLKKRRNAIAEHIEAFERLPSRGNTHE